MQRNRNTGTVQVASYSMPGHLVAAVKDAAERYGLTQSHLMARIVKLQLARATKGLVLRDVTPAAVPETPVGYDAALKPKADYDVPQMRGKRRVYTQHLLEVGEQMRVYYLDGEAPKVCYARTKNSWNSYRKRCSELRTHRFLYQLRREYLLVERVA